MAIANASHGKLLLTADLLQRDRQPRLAARRLEDRTVGFLAVRFQPIEDLVSTLDHIASREFAA